MTTRRPSAFIQRDVEGVGSGSSIVLLTKVALYGQNLRMGEHRLRQSYPINLSHIYSVEDWIETQPFENATSGYRDASETAWAGRWPMENIWKLRKKP